MILSKELIVAVRATVKQLNDKYQTSKSQQRDLELKSVAAFYAANPAVRQKRRRHEQVIAKLRAEEKKLEDYLHSLGLGLHDYHPIVDAKKFVKAGGSVPIELKKPRHIEMTLAMLAGASDREGKLMLKQLGINWS